MTLMASLIASLRANFIPFPSANGTGAIKTLATKQKLRASNLTARQRPTTFCRFPDDG